MVRTGVVIPQYHFDSYGPLTGFGERVDELGYDSLWIGESWGAEAFGVLGYLAAVTEQVELGPAIINVFSRTPTLTGMSVATLDGLCDGRFNLGLGASNPKIIEQWHGVSFDNPLRETVETIDIVEQVLSGDVVECDRGEFELSEFSLRAPIVRSDVPVYVAAIGPQNRRLTGRFADGWIPHNVPFDHLQEAFGEVEHGAESAGRNSDDIEIAPFVPTVIAEDLEYARDRLADHIAYYVGSSELYNVVPARYGFEDEAETIQEYWDNDERAAASAAVSDDMLDVMGLTATPETARKAVEELAETYGIDHALLKFPDRLAEEYLYTAVDALAPRR